MSVRREENHLIIFSEDDPYRSIVNGVQISLNVNERVIESKKKSKGCEKVFEDFEKSIHLLGKYPKCYILLLMDFDDRGNSLSSFEKKKKRLNELANEYLDRVFILGVNHKESEALRRLFGTPNFEKIGKKLVEDCPNGDLSHWRNIHLECNLPEIKRMKDNGVFDWLFC